MSIPQARIRVRLVARRGTTLIELVVVLSIASVLLGITFGALGKVSALRSASSARDSYVWMARRARAAAIQRGTNVRIALVASDARATAALVSDNTVLDQIPLGSDFGATITGVGDSVTITYDPRGIGHPSSTPTVSFTRGGSVAQAQVQGLGQVVVQ